MNITKALLALPLALLLGVATPAVSAQSGGGAPPTQQRPDHGPLAGVWRGPAMGNPGHLRGKLVTPNGIDVYAIEARIDRAAPGAPMGVLVGRATLLNGPRAGTRFRLVGKWQGDGAGKGTFQAKILRKRRGGNAPRVLVDLRGGYRDLAPQRKAGAFKGHWKRHN
ncbi:MAG TPA: hypothetical protein ENJ09_11085 [Planctomycetes bacterium]|nr:hypothetical protein [Planctomycetota bacterium]